MVKIDVTCRIVNRWLQTKRTMRSTLATNGEPEFAVLQHLREYRYFRLKWTAACSFCALKQSNGHPGRQNRRQLAVVGCPASKIRSRAAANVRTFSTRRADCISAAAATGARRRERRRRDIPASNRLDRPRNLVPNNSIDDGIKRRLHTIQFNSIQYLCSEFSSLSWPSRQMCQRLPFD